MTELSGLGVKDVPRDVDAFSFAQERLLFQPFDIIAKSLLLSHAAHHSSAPRLQCVVDLTPTSAQTRSPSDLHSPMALASPIPPEPWVRRSGWSRSLCRINLVGAMAL